MELFKKLPDIKRTFFININVFKNISKKHFCFEDFSKTIFQ